MTAFRPRRAACALALLAPLLFSACDPAGGGGDAPPRGGVLNVRLQGTSAFTGPYDLQMAGQAIFATVGYDGTPRFTIQLQDEGGEPFELLTLATAGTARPAPGTYAAGAEFADGRFYADLSRSQQNPRFSEVLRAEGGTVTITAATASRVDGRLSLTFRDGAYTATASGTFTAVPGR